LHSNVNVRDLTCNPFRILSFSNASDLTEFRYLALEI